MHTCHLLLFERERERGTCAASNVTPLEGVNFLLKKMIPLHGFRRPSLGGHKGGRFAATYGMDEGATCFITDGSMPTFNSQGLGREDKIPRLLQCGFCEVALRGRLRRNLDALRAVQDTSR